MAGRSLSRIPWRQTYDNFFKEACEGLAKDTLYDIAQQIVDPTGKHKPKYGESELAVQMAVGHTPRGRLAALFAKYVKASFLPSSTRNTLLAYNSKPQDMTDKHVDFEHAHLPSPLIFKAPLGLDESVKKPLFEISKGQTPEPKLPIADPLKTYREIQSRWIEYNKSNKQPIKAPEPLSGWEYLDLLILEACGEDGFGIINIQQLIDTIKKEFPDLEAKVGGAAIEIFVRYRALGDLAEDLDVEYAKICEIVSNKIEVALKEVKKA